MQTYVPSAGEMVNETAKRMVALANRSNDTVIAEFNGIKLTAYSNILEEVEVSVAAIVAYYNFESSRRSEAYRSSPEGKRAAADAERRKQNAQHQMDEAMSELDSLDFSDLNAVIVWLEKVRDPSDHIGVVTPHERIVETFTSHGYEPNVNCGNDFDGESKENYARWLIGQALGNLKGVSLGGAEIHAVHQVFHKFAEDWRKKFGYTAK